MTAPEIKAAKYGNRNVPKMYAQINKLRTAIRESGSPEVQDAFDAVEQHIDYAYRAHPPEVLLALMRQAMAAWQMAYDEPDRDELSKAEADQVSARWFVKWMAEGYPAIGKNDGHAEDVLSSVDVALAAMGVK